MWDEPNNEAPWATYEPMKGTVSIHHISLYAKNGSKAFLMPLNRYPDDYLPLINANDPEAADAVVLGHELGHTIFKLRDPTVQHKLGGIVTIVENSLRAAFGIKAREYYGQWINNRLLRSCHCRSKGSMMQSESAILCHPFLTAARNCLQCIIRLRISIIKCGKKGIPISI